MRCFFFLFSFLVQIGLFSAPIDESLCRYSLSVGTVFRDEARFLKEWIEFHKLVGVQHFYLFNDQSKDHYLDVLSPYIESGEVELYENDYPTGTEWQYRQEDCFARCLEMTRGVSRWVAFIDADEFLFPVEQTNLVDFLTDYEEFGGLKVGWVFYGNSRIKQIPEDKLMIECLTKTLSKSDSRNRFGGKCIVKPHRTIRTDLIHNFFYEPPYFQVYEGKQRKFIYSLNKIRINHYWARDLVYFKEVKLPRDLQIVREVAAWENRVFDEDERKRYLKKFQASLNGEKDDAIARFVPSLRKRIFKDE